MKQAGITLVTRAFLLVITFAFNIIIARYLKAEGVGIVGTLMTFAGIGVQFGNLGLAVGAIYFIGLDKKRSGEIAGTLFTMGLLLSVIVFAIFIATASITPAILGNIDFNLYKIALISIAPLILALFFQNILLVYQKITQYNVIELAVRAVSLVSTIAVFIFVDKSDWIIATVWVFIGTALAMGIANIIAVWKISPFKFVFSWNAFRDMIGYGWKSYYGMLMMFLIIRSDIIFLNVFRSEAETGIYRQVVYVSDLVYLIPMTLGTLLFPKLMQAGASAEIGEDDRARFTMLISRLVALFLFVFILLFALIGKWFLGIFGPEFPDGYYPLMILLVGILFLGIESILAAELARRGLPIFVVIYSTICVTVKIAGNFILVPQYGMYGAAWSSLATHLIFLAMVLWFCVKYYGFRVSDTLFVKSSDFKMIRERIKSMLNG